MTYKSARNGTGEVDWGPDAADGGGSLGQSVLPVHSDSVQSLTGRQMFADVPPCGSVT